MREAVRARKAGENVVMKRKSDAKAVEVAKNGGDKSNILKHDGHELPNGETGLPHYQTEGSHGHSFWGGAISMIGLGSELISGLVEDLIDTVAEGVQEAVDNPVDTVCFLCSASSLGDGTLSPQAKQQLKELKEAQEAAKKKPPQPKEEK
jgi:hypothetical protein